MHRLECAGGEEAGERKLPLRFGAASKVKARIDAEQHWGRERQKDACIIVMVIALATGVSFL